MFIIIGDRVFAIVGSAPGNTPLHTYNSHLLSGFTGFFMKPTD